MAELVFRVRGLPGGWVVEGSDAESGWRLEGVNRIGQITDKDSAMDLAHGMASAIRRTGGQAKVLVDPEDES